MTTPMMTPAPKGVSRRTTRAMAVGGMEIAVRETCVGEAGGYLGPERRIEGLPGWLDIYNKLRIELFCRRMNPRSGNFAGKSKLGQREMWR